MNQSLLPKRKTPSSYGLIKKTKLLIILFSIFGFTNAFGQWSTTLNFAEPGFDPNPATAGDHTLVDADMGATTFSYTVDVVTPVAASACPDGSFSEYTEAQDGTDDLMVSITVVRDVSGPQWNNDEVDYDDAGAFRHKFNIGPTNNGASVENDWSYAVIEITFLNGLVVDSDNLCFSSTSTNGSSEMYEYALFYTNNALSPAGISGYTNDIYGGCNAASQTSMGNFLLGNAGVVSEGNLAPGIYTDDGLNTSVSCPPIAEAATTNPGAGSGPSNGVSNVTGAMMGLATGTTITSFTAVLGLHDVAYDTDGNGFTSSNTNPAGRFSQLCIGNSAACPSACTFDVTCPAGPVALGCIDDLPAVADAAAILAEFTDQGGLINDSCNPVMITVADVDDGAMGCTGAPRTVTRTFTVTDPVTAETVDCAIDYVIMDVTPPSITCPAAPKIDCTDAPDPIVYIASSFEGIGTDCTDGPDGEYVQICATEPCFACTSPGIDISGWVIDDNITDGTTNHTIVISSGTLLPGECLTIYSGSLTDPPTVSPMVTGSMGSLFVISSVRQLCTVWNNSGDGIFLYDGSLGTLIDSESWTADGVITYAVPVLADCPTFYPDGIPLACSEPLPPVDLTAPVVSDNCTLVGDIVVTHEGDDVDHATFSFCAADGPFIVNRTYRATDECGNTAECVEILTWEADTEAPVIVCPAAVTVECDASTLPADTGMATATDNCDTAPVITFADAVVAGACAQESVITRTWTATDACGNAITCDQIITVDDSTPPVIVCPAAVTVECDASTLPADTGMATATDNCDTAPVITFADVVVAGACPQESVITRTWTATDACGNAITCDQIITVEDTTAPAITCPADAVVACDASTDPGDTGVATAIDNCDAAPVVTFADVSSQTGEGCGEFGFNIVRTWTATDACGNETTCVQNIDRVDTEAPVVTCPPGQTLTCFETIPAPLTSAADFIAAGGTISDNCTVDLADFTVFSQNSDNGGDNCPTNARLVTRTYFIQDACGNTATCEQVFTYTESTQGPVITSVLPDCYKYCASLVNPMESDITYDTDCNFGATVSITGPVFIGQESCPGSIVQFTYVVTDDCGRSSAPVIRNFIIQNDGPTIQVPPFNLFLECNDPNNQTYLDTHLGLVTANTSCGLGYDISYSPQNIDFTACASSTVVTFTVTDDCGRIATATTTIAVQDNEAPTFTNIPPSICDVTECGGDVNYWYNHWIDYMITGLEAEDNCDTDVSITSGNTPLNTSCDPITGDAVTVVTFVATDNCANTATYVGTFTIENSYPSSFVDVPADASVDCGAPIVFGPAPTVIEGCNTSVMMTTMVDDTDPCNVLHTRVWIATDDCGGFTTTASQTIAETDNAAPVISGGTDLMVECTEDVLAAGQDWAATNAGATATDACTSITWTNNILTAQPVLTPDCAGGTLSYSDITFTATDACGNASSVTYRINVVDTTVPTFTSVPTGGTVECAADMMLTDPTAADACSAVVITSTDVISGDDCSGTLTRTWTATDACGNTVTASATFNYIDTQAPTTSSVPTDMTISCSDAVVFDADPVWSDNCDTDVFSSSEDITSPGDCAGSYSIRRDWSAIDECGNLEVVSQTITVEDNVAPVFTSVPTGGTVDCGSPGFGDAEASDNCSTTVTITFEDEMSGTGCAGGVTRTWTATDECGNAATASATFTINDDEAPVFTSVPTGGMMDCGDPDFGDAEATDNCSATVTITFEDEMSGTGCSGGGTTRTWTATDACGNTATASATYIINDDEAPVFTSVPTGGTEECGNAVSFGEAEATDNCGTVTITSSDQMTGGCVGSVTRTWTATDVCGNTVTASATITFSDDEAPVFTFIPDVVDLDCDDDLTPEAPEASDICGAVTVEITDEDINGALCDDGYAINYTWTATDACGNTATTETQIWIDPDNEAPVFTYVPPGDYGDCDNFPPVFGEPVVEDACGSVTLTFIDEAIGNPDGCDENENFDYRRVWTATDACGNTSTAKQTFWILVTGPSSNVGGLIATEEGDAVEDVEVTLTGGADLIQTYITEEDGMYEFANLATGANYMVDPYSNEFPMNGVSTFDLILISKHILELEMLDSPYKMIAADINRSGSITTFDLVQLRKMILVITTEFPDNDSWRFVNADFIFPYFDNPFATSFPEIANINGLLGNEMHDFVGVKIGDVNGSVVANELVGADDRTFDGELPINVKDMLMKEGGTYEVVFNSKEFNAIAGYQYTLNFDTDLLEFVDVTAGDLVGLSKENFGLDLLDEGAITTSWMTNSPVSMSANADLFRITFKAKRTTQLSQALSVNSRYTPAEAYDLSTENGQLNLLNVNLRFEDLIVTSSPFALMQNMPNPFRDQTVIGFVLPETTSATMTIYDVSGRQLKVLSGDFETGYNEINLDRSDLPRGVLFYELKTSTNTATKKMFLIN